MRLSKCVCLVLALWAALPCSRSFADDVVAPAAKTAGQYAVTKTFKVGGEGRWDYATLDAESNLLYVTRGTHTNAIDVTTGTMVGDIGPSGQVHGVAVVPVVGRGFVSDGKAATVTVFDLKTRQILGNIPAAEDADGIVYDPSTHRVLVVCGDAGSLILINPDVDPKAGKPEATIDLGGKPEFFAVDGAGKAFINLNDKNEVAVVDIKSAKVVSRWPTGTGTKPAGMAIDPVGRRLFVGCRNQKLIVMSADDGHVLADLPIGKGVDATAFASGLAFASCSDGTLAIARETSPGKYEIMQTVQTARGSRTMAVDPTGKTVYLPGAEYDAVTPGSGNRPAMKSGSFNIQVVTAPEH